MAFQNMETVVDLGGSDLFVNTLRIGVGSPGEVSYNNVPGTLVGAGGGGGGGSGTVTSVGMVTPIGLAVSGTPITTSGIFSLSWSGTIPPAQFPVFTAIAQGATPASGGGVTNFLRADGSWATPAGAGTVTSVAATVPTGLAISGSPITSSGTLGITWSGTIPAAQIPDFTTSVNGGVPGSGGGTTNFLRADGTWAAPPGAGGGPGGSNTQIQFNNSGAFGGLTNTQVTARINVFTSSLSGATPASGGGTANFLRADGAWVTPPGGGGGSSIRTQRSVTSSPITVSSGDQILNVNIKTGTPLCTLPIATGRAGNAVTFKDVGGNFSSNELVITPNSGDTIDGQPVLILNNNFQTATLVPFNDGVNTGWSIE
jgi:hypothetical protein